GVGFEEIARGGLAAVERARQVHVERVLPVFLFCAQQQSVDGDAGVIDQHVEAAALGGDLLDGGADGGGVGHVEAGERALAALGLDRLERLGRGGFVR